MKKYVKIYEKICEKKIFFIYFFIIYLLCIFSYIFSYIFSGKPLGKQCQGPYLQFGVAAVFKASAKPLRYGAARRDGVGTLRCWLQAQRPDGPGSQWVETATWSRAPWPLNYRITRAWLWDYGIIGFSDYRKQNHGITEYRTTRLQEYRIKALRIYRITRVQGYMIIGLRNDRITRL